MLSRVSSFLLFSATVSAAPHSWKDFTFTDFVKKFKKSYTDDELAKRIQIFEENKKLILDHNEKKLSWTMEINQFADLTVAEHKKLYKGLNKEKHFARDIRTVDASEIPSYGKYPKSVDWREKNILTPVKNQGQCGSCWAFAATETMESYYALKTGKLKELSVQSVVSCTKNPNHCGGTGGCSGATAELGIEGVAKRGGIPLASEYPYTSGGGDSGTCWNNVKPAANFTGFVKVQENDIEAVMSVLGNHGPLAITVDASQWMFYSSGVLTPANYGKLDLDHGVQAVGYGTDGGQDYWIVRNSWGESWGENGYLRIARTDGSKQFCGVDDTPHDGTACAGGPTQITACGSFGILYDTCYAVGASDPKL
jgi:cathepsin L